MRTAVIIPARYDSTRFPGKPLIDILGIPMIIRVADICSQAVGKEAVFIATENVKITEVCERFNYKSIMTSKEALTGTDRVAEASQKIKADIYINVQGDEPTINPKNINDVILAKSKNYDYVINSFYEISEIEDPLSKNIPKVVMNEENFLLYMSRSLIPGSKNNNIKNHKYYKQVCIYGFSKNELDIYLNYGRKSILEQIEDIEILRFFELNKKIMMVPASNNSLAVDEPSDVSKVENYLLKKS